MSSDQQPTVRLESISKRFPGVQALDDVSLDVYPGEIHAVVGENGAGKTTLMNILAGEVEPDSGRIVYLGEERQIPNPFVSQQLGITVVYQETALCPNLTVAENISLNRVGPSRSLSMLNRDQFLDVARRAMNQLGVHDLEPDREVGTLSIAQQQIVEIMRAISTEAKILILDEPNSALTQEESTYLFSALRKLRDDGVGIIYVSHRLEEVMDLADRITVLRDGRYIDTMEPSDVTIDGLISNMVGRVVDSLYERHGGSAAQDRWTLEIRDLTSGDALKDITFGVRAGEVVGVAGLPGSGKEELVECCFGLRPFTGQVLIDGESAGIRSPQAAIQQGVSLIPADRRAEGAILLMSVRDNVVAASLPAVSRVGLLDQGGIRSLARRYVDKLDVRAASLSQRMATLSGGNQQKVILARGLATRPSVLILHEPTRGIDVGAKAEIYGILQDLASDGVAILIVSSELPELMGQCDRILALCDGRITGHFEREESDEELILACAMGQATHL